MSELQACDFKDPENLKEILELLDKLKDAYGISGAVLVTLEEEAKKYFKDDSDGLTSPLGGVFTGAQWIRSTILENSESYPKYSSLTGHEGHDCVPRALKKCLPKAYAALYYLYFMGSQDLKSSIHGGKWDTNNKCNVNSCMLYKWLTDDQYDVKMKGLISRGFPSQTSSLTDKTAQDVAEQIKESLKHDTPGDLQNVLLYLLFVCPWHDSLLGHACVFLSTFCDQVQDQENFQKYFSSSALEELKRVCSTVKSHLQPFIDGSVTYLQAVCQSNGTLYSALWNPEAIPLYVKWLKENLNGIIGSLQSMSGEASSKWDSGNLQTAETAGPFRFGFVFKGSWNDYTFKNNLPSKISPLTGSGSGFLQSLQKSLENFSTGNPGATAGGVFTGILGTGGLGAGAAYATNAFGLKDIITGLISSFLK